MDLCWVVEDDVETQRLVAHALHDLDIIALPFFTAESALRYRAVTSPTFALVDVGLPKMNGFELARELRLDKTFARLPLLFMTATSAPEQEERAREAGGLFLAKPFRLPALRDAVRQLRTQAERVAADRAAAGVRKARVLIVDDDPEIREALSMLVDEEGHEAVVAADAFEALDLCGGNAPRPDVAFIDIMLPGLDGTALATRLKKAKPMANTPIVMISAFDSLPEEAARVGAVAALKKPFQRDDFAGVLLRTLPPRASV